MNCQGCGSSLRGSELFCPYCGREVDQPKESGPQQVHYHNHYYQQAPQQPVYQQPSYVQPHYAQRSESDKSRGVMLILAFLLGALGAHWFYVGRFGKGVLYLLTMGLFGLGVFVDVFVILLGNPRDAQGRRIQW